MAKTKKNYELKTGDGKFEFKVLKTSDGKPHSVCGAYPVICATATGVRKLSRKETEKFCLEVAIENGWFPADGNK